MGPIGNLLALLVCVGMLAVHQAMSQGGEGDRCTCDASYCAVRAVDVIVVLDESPSMRWERAWLTYVLQQLDSELRLTKNVGADERDCPNRYGVFRFGRTGDGCPAPLYGNGSAAADVFLPLAAMLAAFPDEGPTNAATCEDGYSALAGALRAPRRSVGPASCVKPLVILLTDEDRKRCGCPRSASKKDLLRGHFKDSVSGVEVAMIIDQAFSYNGSACLGMGPRRKCFLGDEQTYQDFYAASPGIVGQAYGKTNTHYTRMALKKEVSGAAWDINMIRRRSTWHVAHAMRQQLYSGVSVCSTEPSEPPTVACSPPVPPQNGAVRNSVIDGQAVVTVTCASGYSLVGASVLECMSGGQYSAPTPVCRDVDECIEATACPQNSACANNIGSFTCQCSQGFTADGSGGCANIDECAGGSHRCDARSTACADTIGTYSCSCLAGYATHNSTHCTNRDECSDGGAMCHAMADCLDLLGSYMCTCQAGYTGDGSNACNRLAVDECSDGSARCHARADCVDTADSYQCVCRSGYSGSGVTCNDIDECRSSLADCDASSTNCRNTDGSFTCRCDSTGGYARANRTHCDNIDECARGTARCHARSDCLDTRGSYRCSCRRGYSGDGVRECSNVDECRSGQDDCDASSTCADTDGSFECQCPSGYRQSGGGTQCQDINECAMGQDNCLATAICINTPGAFECACPAGLVGDGVTSCISACILDNGATLPVGQSSVVHAVTTRPPDAAAMSACVVFVLTEGNSGGLPNGIGWIPSRNISQRLNSRAEALGFVNNRFCLVTDGLASGRTVNVGATSACGSPSELDAAVQGLRSTAAIPSLASAMDGQLTAGSTCAGSANHLTVIVQLLPAEPAESTVLADGTALKNVVDRDAVVLVMGPTEADHQDSDGYVIALDYNRNGYEGFVAGPAFVNHDDGNGVLLNDQAGFNQYASAALQTGGILLDASWIVDPQGEHRGSVEGVLVSYFGTALQNLRDASCSRCTCVTAGDLQCGSGRHVIVPSLCLALYGSGAQ